MGPRLGEMACLCTASKLLTGHLITGTAQVYRSLIGLLEWLYLCEAHFECHDILMLGKSPIKWRQRPDLTIAIDWGVKHHFK